MNDQKPQGIQFYSTLMAHVVEESNKLRKRLNLEPDSGDRLREARGLTDAQIVERGLLDVLHEEREDLERQLNIEPDPGVSLSS